jgi:hypothetical protein
MRRFPILAFLLLCLPSGASRNFNGSSSILYVSATGTPLDITSGPLTVSFWFYATTTPGGGGGSNQTLVANWTPGGKTQFITGFNIVGTNNALQWFVGTGGPLLGVYGTCPFNTVINTWYHVRLSIDTVGGTAGLTQNGTPCQGQSYRESRSTAQNFTIGGQCNPCPGTSSLFFTGYIAEVGVWNSTLSAGEATALDRGVIPIKIRRANLVGYFPLWASASPEPDLSGNKDNLAVSGATVAPHCPCGSQAGVP